MPVAPKLPTPTPSNWNPQEIAATGAPPVLHRRYKPGFTRKPSRSADGGFDYLRSRKASACHGRGRDQTHQLALAIPPAYTEVWICPSKNGHLQATGRDAKGRKQYRYHPKWRETADANKYGRVMAFAAALPGIRKRIDADLARPGLPREKVLATVVKLLETTLIRVGNEEYAKSNKHYGLTTMQNRHVKVKGGHDWIFSFRGKSGIDHDDRVAKPPVWRSVVQRCQELPGHDLIPVSRRERRGATASTRAT